MKGLTERGLEHLDFKDQSAVMAEREYRAKQARALKARQENEVNRWRAVKQRAWLEENWDLGL